MPSYFAKYTFNRNDTNYINAVSTFNQGFRIESINGVNPAEVSFCKDLKHILLSTQSDQITIVCRAPESIATEGIFPQINDAILEKAIDNVRFTADRISDIRGVVRGFINYVKEVLREENQGDKWRLITHDLGVMGPTLYDSYLGLDQLDQKEALVILNALKQALPLEQARNISGAVNLPSINQILFQVEGINFIISYDNDSRRPNLCKARPFAFNIDTGFTSLGHEDEGVIPLGYEQELLKELQKYFVTWKHNNYEGSIPIADRNAKLAAIN